MLVPSLFNLSGLASSDDWEDGDDEDDAQTEHSKLSEDDEWGWVMGTISNKIQQPLETFQQNQMKLDEWTQQGVEYSTDYFRERTMKYGTSALSVLAVVQPRTHDDTPEFDGQHLASLARVLI